MENDQARNEVTWKQWALYTLMSDISESCYAAGWMRGNEYILWNMVSDSKASRVYGYSDVSEEHIAWLREISSEIDGWFVWDENRHEARFCPLDDWLFLYKSSPYTEQWLAKAQKEGP